MSSSCRYEDCSKPRGKGSTLCGGHRTQWERHHELKPLRDIHLTAEQRFWSFVEKDPEPGCWKWIGAHHELGYGIMGIGQRLVKAHRFSYELVNGPIVPRMVIDHICHVTSCVNPAHLRAVSHKQNLEHRAGANRNSKTGVRGVCWSERYQQYVAQIKHNYVNAYYARFDTLEEATAAVIDARNRIFTHNDADRVA